MTPRKRSSLKKGWPDYLYERDGYYSWRHPETRVEYGLGRDKAGAFRQAIEANLHLAGALRQERLIDRITETAGRTVQEWATKYDEILKDRPLAPSTRKFYQSMSKRMVAMIGARTILKRVTPMQVAEGLDALVKTHARTAQALRLFMRDSFSAACLKGWLDDSPLRDIRANKVTVRRARLTLQVLQQVYARSDCAWLRNAIALAMVTGQRREDVAVARFKDVRDGFWWCEQKKTKNRVALPLHLRLNAFGMSLDDVVRQCRSTGVLSHYLVHQTERFSNSPPGKKISKDTITRRFSDALALLQIDFGDKDPPTFHEIRSLAARLYKKQGSVNVQDLLGHDSPESTQIYEDGRGEWLEVQVKGATV